MPTDTAPGASRHRLFLAAAPGVEPLLLGEVRALGFADARQVEGGVELGADREGIWRLCLTCRLAEGIRVRVGSFPAPDFAALEAGLGRLPLAAWWPRGGAPEVAVTSHRSRIYHQRAAAERAQAAMAARLAGGPGGPCAPAHLRIVADEATLSVDASGPLLHRRGWRQAVGHASLRETLAAAVLRAADQASPLPTDAPAPAQPLLWDPFCGAGTFPIEHAGMLLGHPAAGERSFAFEAWPTHDLDAWAALRGALPRQDAPGVLTLGSDRSADEVEAARANAARAGLAQACRFTVGDFEDVAPTIPPGTAIVTNPPWGRRAGGRGVRRTWERLGDLLRARPDLGPVVALCGDGALRQATGLKWQVILTFLHGGLRVEALALRRG